MVAFSSPFQTIYSIVLGHWMDVISQSRVNARGWHCQETAQALRCPTTTWGWLPATVSGRDLFRFAEIGCGGNSNTFHIPLKSKTQPLPLFSAVMGPGPKKLPRGTRQTRKEEPASLAHHLLSKMEAATFLLTAEELPTSIPFLFSEKYRRPNPNFHAIETERERRYTQRLSDCSLVSGKRYLLRSRRTIIIFFFHWTGHQLTRANGVLEFFSLLCVLFLDTNNWKQETEGQDFSLHLNYPLSHKNNFTVYWKANLRDDLCLVSSFSRCLLSRCRSSFSLLVLCRS